MPPTVTPRSAPSGKRLEDGFPTLFAFAEDPDVSLWEMTVSPPGVDGGDAVETMTMHNTTWRTKGPRKLKELMAMDCTCAYDPACYPQLVDLINIRTAVTVHFPDESSLSFWGYLQRFEPDEIEEGTMPQASVTIQPTNQNPTTGAEEDPVFTPAPPAPLPFAPEPGMTSPEAQAARHGEARGQSTQPRPDIQPATTARRRSGRGGMTVMQPTGPRQREVYQPERREAMEEGTPPRRPSERPPREEV